MPVSKTLMASLIKAQMALQGFKGRDMGKIADAVASAVYTHVSLPNVISCQTNGTAGPTGTVTSTGVVGIVSPVMSKLMYAKAVTAGFKGRDMGKLWRSVSSGVSTNLSTMVFNGTTVGIAVGGGTGRFMLLNVQVLSKLILAQLTLRKIIGRDARKLADSIAAGVVNQLKAGATFPLIVAGAPAPVPPVGPVPVAMIPTVYSKVY